MTVVEIIKVLGGIVIVCLMLWYVYMKQWKYVLKGSIVVIVLTLLSSLQF